MSCTETCLRACSIKLTNGIDSGMRIPPCVYFACVRIPGAREDSHSLRNQLIWDTTARAPNEWAIHFDISSVPIGKSVPIDFSVTFWNAFQEPSQWWGGFRILHQTKRMLYEIKFPPDKHPRSDSILYVTKSDENDEQPFDESPVSTVTYDAEGKVEAIS